MVVSALENRRMRRERYGLRGGGGGGGGPGGNQIFLFKTLLSAQKVSGLVRDLLELFGKTLARGVCGGGTIFFSVHSGG